MTDTCSTCRFWSFVDHHADFPQEKQARWGFCRRYPPAVGHAEESGYGFMSDTPGGWPTTDGSDWCGEYISDEDDPTPYTKRSPLEYERDMEDGFDTVEFLASSCRDIETGEPLEQTARPDLYVRDVQIVIDDWRAMEAEIERLREVLEIMDDTIVARSELFVSDQECLFNLRDRIRRALKETTDE